MTTTRVVFRKFRNGEVIAIFPDMPECCGAFNSYMHVGQHGAAVSVPTGTKLATSEEYAPLLRELQAIGYEDLQPVKRCSRRGSR